MTVLILSNLEDVHARAVMGALAAQGTHAELVDLSEFPTRLALSLAFEDRRRRFQLRRLGGGALDLATVESVWWRRPQPFSPPAGLDEAGFRLSMSESRTAFQGLYQALEARWINEPARDAVASHKSYQLALAQEIGFDIPPTLMTNDVEGAKAFWRRYEGEVIFKQFFALPEAWRETRRLRPEDEAQAAAVAHAPVIFQKHVPAVADLRVVVVAGELFAAAADVRNAEYPQDVRMNLSAKYEPHDLPPEIAAKLGELMRRLGLVYGAIDLRLTPEGQYVFLEINPAGQFLYVEHATGQPITAALAKALLERPPVAPPPDPAGLSSPRRAGSSKASRRSGRPTSIGAGEAATG
jgi:glutathione synthase/RimK-type ligase-like ATP-grasp enzyme